MSTPRTKLKAPKSLRPIPTPTRAESLIAAGSGYVKRRSFVYAAGFAVITIAGTLIGATLKSSQQAEEKKVVRQKVQVDVGEQIAVLDETRLNLVQRKKQLEKKIEEVKERQVREEQREAEREALRKKGDELNRQMAMERGRG